MRWFESNLVEMLRRTPLGRGTKTLKRSGFKSRGSGLKATKSLTAKKSMNKVGKVGKANLDANKLIRAYLKRSPIQYCELGFSECLGTSFLQIAHKHPRAWYKGDVELLADPKLWIVACQNCHQTLDKRTDESKQLTETVFEQLRP